ncbi:sister chromatid cohesion protein Mis4 [Aspergillus luchuensis]|uniref:Sister chromatid cohesion protein Mis4 n=1 Tax=Aspergillus kawachii TaxID=1069201 RepID=A0A146G0W9_ASPKA|nr:sister chromatid cohesion protein Mis4 [Aspergillus luchuensis]
MGCLASIAPPGAAEDAAKSVGGCCSRTGEQVVGASLAAMASCGGWRRKLVRSGEASRVIMSRGVRFCDGFVVDDWIEVAFSRRMAALLSLFLGGRPVLLSGLYTHWTPLWLHRQHEGLPRLHRPFVVVMVVVVFDGAESLMAVLKADTGSISGSRGKISSWGKGGSLL